MKQKCYLLETNNASTFVYFKQMIIITVCSSAMISHFGRREAHPYGR